MINNNILVSPCESLISEAPLDDLRKKLAQIVEEKFKKLGEATLVIGCMHYPRGAEEPFVQTQILLSDFYPKTFCNHEDHSHSKAVTIDMRSSPVESSEYFLESGVRFAITSPSPALHPHGPDVARRDFTRISHIQDFKYVKGIKKIYLERVPFFEKGPSVENLDLFREIHNLLDKGGIFAFDYVPFYNLFKCNRESISYFSNRALPEARVATPEEFEQIKKSIADPAINKLADHLQFTCSHKKNCPTNPCEELVGAVAKSILKKQIKEEQLAAIKKKVSAEAKLKPKAALTKEEVLIKVDSAIRSLDWFIRADQKDLFLGSFGPNGIAVFCSPNRSPAEMESLLYQVGCYRTLNVVPELEKEIDPATKKLLDLSLSNLVQKVVFPQLKLLGFEPVSFSPNGVNQENNRQFSRVIYTRK